MNRILDTSVNALQLAGSLTGVPYVGAAAVVLQEITTCCQQVAVHKVNPAVQLVLRLPPNGKWLFVQRKANRLADKSCRLLLTLRDQSARLEGTDLLQAVDEVNAYAILVLLSSASSLNRCYMLGHQYLGKGS